MNSTIEKSQIQKLITMALSEDIGDGDITSQAIFKKSDISEGKITVKEEGIFCGGNVFKFVYEEINKNINVTPLVMDGDRIGKGSEVIYLQGPTQDLLAGERTALNFIQRMSGIATKTRQLVDLLAGSGITLLDTRKTVPAFRILDKYAVKIGGGTNHRFGLFDMVMIKDNHIHAAGSITNAVKLVREKYSSRYQIEVETSTLDEVREALDAGANIIMLDNMPPDITEKSIKLVNRQAKIEVSGNIDEKKLREIKHLAIDYISIGGLTHSVKAFDLSMKFY
jgi:nicotinate-nucleotide pyrophosphorylase (carboxylating)